MSTSFRLLLPAELYNEILQQAKAELPNECCGMLVGTLEERDGVRVGVVRRRYPLVNELASPRAFRAEVQGLFAVAKDRRRNGYEELAIYHSHPQSPPIPSATDRACNYGEEVMSLIVTLLTDPPQMCGWWLTSESHRPAEWEVVP